jgi:hypothetical protein
MNSFDVPYDENLFESNDFMKSYWERSTENRNVAFVQDLRMNEIVNDDSEMRDMTMDAFEDDSVELDKTVGLVENVGRIEASSFNVAQESKTLLPKALSNSTAVIWAVIAIGAIFVFLINSKPSSRLRE